MNRLWRVLLPLGVGVGAIAAWEAAVQLAQLPVYLVPGPWKVAQTLTSDWGSLSDSLLVTLRVTFIALALAVAGGVGLALVFTSSKPVERSLYPFAVILQVTPVVAIVPLLLIYIRNIQAVLLICAWLVAFFPILSNTTLGLNTVDPNFLDLMQLYRARRWQVLWHLRIPGALPYFLAALRISGGLSLIGAVVAEQTAGTVAGGSGLAYRILESSNRLATPTTFSALALLSGAGLIIFGTFSLLSWALLHRWHDSAAPRER